MGALKRVDIPATPEPVSDLSRPNELKKPASLWVGSLWMIGITLALFFLPLLNGFFGGLVGGYKVGSVERALMAALLPAFVASLGLWIILGIFGLPFIGFLAGVTTGVIILIADVGIFLGAVIGGAISTRRTTPRNH